MKNFYIISVDKIYSSREPGLTCNVNEYIKRPNKSTFWCRIWVIDTLRQHECKDCQAAGPGTSIQQCLLPARGAVTCAGRLSLVADGEAGDNNTTTLLLLLPTLTLTLAAHTCYSGWNICIGHRIPPPHLSLHCFTDCHIVTVIVKAEPGHGGTAAEVRSTETRRGVISNERRAVIDSLRCTGSRLRLETLSTMTQNISKICIFIFFIISFVAMSR